MVTLTREEMEILTTKRLLAFRKKHMTYRGPELSHEDGCTCFDCKFDQQNEQQLSMAKEILATREHVEK